MTDKQGGLLANVIYVIAELRRRESRLLELALRLQIADQERLDAEKRGVTKRRLNSVEARWSRAYRELERVVWDTEHDPIIQTEGE